MAVMNREAWRRLEKSIGKEAHILCSAIAERAGFENGRALMLAYSDVPEAERAGKLREMREWVSEFDAGEIVPDDETDGIEGAND